MKSRNIILSLALMGCTAANALTLQQAKKIIFRRRIRQSSVDIPGTRKKKSRQRILQPMVRCLPL